MGNRLIWKRGEKIMDIVDVERSTEQMRSAWACMLRELDEQSEIAGPGEMWQEYGK